jgi:WD40 repeat protein
VVTGSIDLTARVWDAETGQALTEPLKHNNPVSRVCFSPDGLRIATGCWNGEARLWDANTGLPLTEWFAGTSAATSVCFDSTGQRISIAARGAFLWNVPEAPTPVPAWFPAFAEAVAGLRLSERGNVELVPRHELESARDRLASGNAGDFYGRLAQWFLAEPSQRASNPF